jgi:hypothetical protein
LAASQLKEMIESAEKSLSGEQIESFYRDMRSLYEGKPWASDVISRLPKPQQAVP